MKTSNLLAFHLPTHIAVLLMLVSTGISSCNMPKPAAGGQEPTDVRNLATSQQSIQGTSQGKADMDCQKTNPWYLAVNHDFTLSISETSFTISVQGSGTLSVDKTGNVTAGPATGVGTMTSENTDCTFMSIFKYNATVTGTCSRGIMNLSIEELFGEGGAVTGTLKCGDHAPVTQYFGFPAMQHDLNMPLNSKAGGGSKTIPWGIGGTGTKKWYVSNTFSAPLEPLTGP